MSQNFHAEALINGREEKVLKLLQPETYSRYNKIFNGMGSLHRSVQKDLVPTSGLKAQFDSIHEICMDSLSQLTDDIRDKSLTHSVQASGNKYEALSWCFKHEMWHSAEMEDIKRALGYPIKWLRN
jgi:hypothetical protein